MSPDDDHVHETLFFTIQKQTFAFQIKLTVFSMRVTLRFLIPMLALLASPIFAQQNSDNYCGTTGITPWFKWYCAHRNVLAQDRGGDTSWLYVPVTVQITGTDSGTEYYNLEQAIISMDNMNRQFTDARIRYYLMPGDPVRFLNNSTWHDHDWGGGADLIETNKLPDRLNAFVVKNPAGACGYSWIDAIVLGKNCSGPYNSTWAHEAGHHFSLPHPFFGWEGTTWNYANPAPMQTNGWEVEKTDGSNCYNSGDYFCDTRPDYLNYRWSCDQNRESTVLQRDPDGVEFRSDATLFMSYSLDACASRFTPEQIAAMRENIMTEHSSYLQINEPLQEISDSDPVELVSPIDTAIVQFNNVTFSWNPVPNASLYTVEVFLHSNLVGRVVWQTEYNSTTYKITKALPNNRLLYWRVRPYSEWDLSKQLAPQQVGVFRTANATATNELERVLQADLSPNPVSMGASAKLLLNADQNLDAFLTITDAAGRRCYEQSYVIPSGENLIDVPTENLNAGLYFITLQNAQGIIQKRLAITQ
jgi:hypothetical protein